MNETGQREPNGGNRRVVDRAAGDTPTAATDTTKTRDHAHPAPSATEQVRTWIAIGSQSIGGGSSTLYLMRQRLIERHGWLTRADFVQDWTISKLTPGMTIVALAAMLGRRAGGRRGIAIALAGLLIPSGLITTLMTAGYGLIQNQPLAQAALLGMGMVTVGLTIGVQAGLAQSAVRKGRRAAFDWAFVAVACVVGLVAPGAPLPVIVGSLVLGMLLLRDRGEERDLGPID
jgi:chromate transporter